MRKTQIPTISLLAIIMVAICFLHACDKGEEDCQTCTAHKNGNLVATSTMCTEIEREAFKALYPGHEIICRN
jgi:hypothetical protein